MSTPENFQSKTYLYRDHPYFYATLTDLEPGMGLLQIHSDWGTYSYFWPGMGDDTLAEFLASTEPSYVETKLSSMLGFMGMRKEAYSRLTKFMAQCWPRLMDTLRAERRSP
jgi:hypothetical protein